MSRITATLLLLTLVIPAAAQKSQSKNAALRYWQAFALMQDVPTSEADARELDSIVKGELPWDEAKFGTLIDRNAEALATMRRATELPICDWGLDLDLGPAAPVAHIAKARALARLNALAGIRLASQGNQRQAVDTWLNGFRFAQHLSQDGTMVGVLVASASFSAQMHAISRSVQDGTWDDASLSRIETFLKDVPHYVFDWSRPMLTEHQAMTLILSQFSGHPSQEALRQSLGDLTPSEFDRLRSSAPESEKQFSTIYTQAASAMRLPYVEAKPRLAAIQSTINRATPFVQKTVPNLQRFNDARAQLEEDRILLIKRIAALRHP
jgi:hypothetical protein